MFPNMKPPSSSSSSSSSSVKPGVSFSKPSVATSSSTPSPYSVASNPIVKEEKKAPVVNTSLINKAINSNGTTSTPSSNVDINGAITKLTSVMEKFASLLEAAGNIVMKETTLKEESMVLQQKENKARERNLSEQTSILKVLGVYYNNVSDQNTLITILNEALNKNLPDTSTPIPPPRQEKKTAKKRKAKVDEDATDEEVPQRVSFPRNPPASRKRQKQPIPDDDDEQTQQEAPQEPISIEDQLVQIPDEEKEEEEDLTE